MEGQWKGKYSGDESGEIIANIDLVSDHYEIVIYAYPDQKEIPLSVVYTETKSTNDDEHQITGVINVVDRKEGIEKDWNSIKDRYPEGTTHAQSVNITLKKESNKLIINAETDNKLKLNSTLTNPFDNQQSSLEAKVFNWSEFKDYITTLPIDELIFRGQKKPWKLRTSYHRAKRFRVREFVNKDVPQLHRKLSGITKHYFDTRDAKQNGAFFNLLQHHGYPTPILDWSFSPYVSAFFAFRSIAKNYDGDDFVRIFLFNHTAWHRSYNPIYFLDNVYPHFSVSEFIAIDNPRVVPQQSVTTVTNIDDIEELLIERSKVDNTQYLQAIDIKANEREKVMLDLRLMGIAAGSMFPSIDGVCEEMKEINF